MTHIPPRLTRVVVMLLCITFPPLIHAQTSATKPGAANMSVSVTSLATSTENTPTGNASTGTRTSTPSNPRAKAPAAASANAPANASANASAPGTAISDSAAGVTVPVKPNAHPTMKTIVVDREIFQYTATSRRDPFVSLLTSDELRPLLSDLRLTTVAYDPSGRSSVAVLRNLETKQQYRVTRGQQLGRMRVVRIDQKSVTFVIEEYGFSRQETLAMTDTSTTTTP